jgi:hypothetical protein
MLEQGDFVPIENCTVFSSMPLGLFVIVAERKVFMPFHFILRDRLTSYAQGDVITLLVLRSYAAQEGLVS